MGLCNRPNIFQEEMNKLFNILEYFRTCIDDLFIVSNKSFEDHINKLDKVLSKLNQKYFKLNAEESFFVRSALEYLRFRIIRQGIISLSDKVEATKYIRIPTTKK